MSLAQNCQFRPAQIILFWDILKPPLQWPADSAGTMDKPLYSQNQIVLQALLRDLRKERGLRQQELANRIGEPQSFVSKYETGERRLDILELREICRALGFSLADFVARLEERLGG